MLDFLYSIGIIPAFFLFFIENLIIILGVVAIGFAIQKKIDRKAQFIISGKEYMFALLTLVINTLVTFAGFLMWRYHWIDFDTSFSWKIGLDCVVLFLVMDSAMYILHVIIHHSIFYKPVHGLHHDYTKPSPIDLFVLNPLETFSFGSLWLILITLYTSNIYAVVMYLTLNVVFGMLGHLSVEPFPKNWMKIPVLNYICTSTFHYLHHKEEKYNFGFYTILWDKLFGTLSPHYKEQFLLEKEKQQ
jgi:lathosterol oxidase